MKVHFTLLLLVILFSTSCLSQSTKSITDKIDALFIPWNKSIAPGAAVAVIKDGKVIYKKAYGMANLEYKQPLTPSSIFHIA
jgi:CubicO group peptidase (beta-lactamase class C family)